VGKAHRHSGRDDNSFAGVKYFSLKLLRSHTGLSSRPERTRISYFALLATTTGAVSRKGNRMNPINATGLNRKSGEAKWRDLPFFSRYSHTVQKALKQHPMIA
jgi:hypothetical protein